MEVFSNRNRWLGLFFVLFAIVLMFVWVPLDTETGVVEIQRRRMTVGDALGPTVAGAFLLLGGVLVLMFPGFDDDRLLTANVMWVLALLGLFAIATALMRYAGPAVAALLTEDGYRPLRGTIPWKYIGYLAGGTVLVGGLSSFVRRRFALSDWAIAFAAALLIALAYDLPFDDLQLPPNADV